MYVKRIAKTQCSTRRRLVRSGFITRRRSRFDGRVNNCLRGPRRYFITIAFVRTTGRDRRKIKNNPRRRRDRVSSSASVSEFSLLRISIISFVCARFVMFWHGFQFTDVHILFCEHQIILYQRTLFARKMWLLFVHATEVDGGSLRVFVCTRPRSLGEQNRHTYTTI